MNKFKKMTLKQLKKINHSSWVEIQEKENSKRNKALKEFVGKCYKYRNCYSCPQEEKDYWWMYICVKDIKDGYLVCQTFQKDSDGKIIINLNEKISSVSDKHILCGKATFNLELEKMMVEIKVKSNGFIVGDDYGVEE